MCCPNCGSAAFKYFLFLFQLSIETAPHFPVSLFQSAFGLTETLMLNCPSSADSWSRHPRPCSRPDRRSELHQPPLCGLRLRRQQRMDEGRSAPPNRQQNKLLCWQWNCIHTTCSQLQPRHLPVPSQQPSQHHDNGLQSNRQLWVRLTELFAGWCLTLCTRWLFIFPLSRRSSKRDHLGTGGSGTRPAGGAGVQSGLCPSSKLQLDVQQQRDARQCLHLPDREDGDGELWKLHLYCQKFSDHEGKFYSFWFERWQKQLLCCFFDAFKITNAVFVFVFEFYWSILHFPKLFRWSSTDQHTDCPRSHVARWDCQGDFTSLFIFHVCPEVSFLTLLFSL